MNKIKIVKLIDPNGVVYGIQQTDGEIHIIGKAYTGATYQSLQLDSSSFALKILSHAEAEVHEGHSFCAHVYEADFDKADSIGILFATPNTSSRLHLLPKVYAGASALFQICEAPTLDVGEYSITFHVPTQRDRNSSITSGIRSWRAAPVTNQYSEKVVADESPVTGDGLVIYSEVIGSGKQGGGGPNLETGVFILKQNTTYYFRLAGMAAGADNSVACMTLVWYEHSDLE